MEGTSVSSTAFLPCVVAVSEGNLLDNWATNSPDTSAGAPIHVSAGREGGVGINSRSAQAGQGLAGSVIKPRPQAVAQGLTLSLKTAPAWALDCLPPAGGNRAVRRDRTGDGRAGSPDPAPVRLMKDRHAVGGRIHMLRYHPPVTATTALFSLAPWLPHL